MQAKIKSYFKALWVLAMAPTLAYHYSLVIKVTADIVAPLNAIRTGHCQNYTHLLYSTETGK